jgi:hypothetical protein
MINRETEAPAAATVTLRVGVAMSEILSVCTLAIETDSVGVMDRDILAGAILRTSTANEGVILRDTVAGAILRAEMEIVGEILRETDPLRPPTNKEIVGIILRLRDAGVET